MKMKKIIGPATILSLLSTPIAVYGEEAAVQPTPTPAADAPASVDNYVALREPEPAHTTSWTDIIYGPFSLAASTARGAYNFFNDYMDSGCFSCTVTSYTRNLRESFPSLEYPISLFTGIRDKLNSPQICLDVYGSRHAAQASQKASEAEYTRQLCSCMAEASADEPKLTASDISSLDMIMRDRIRENTKKQFRDEKFVEKIVDDFTSIRNAILFDALVGNVVFKVEGQEGNTAENHPCYKSIDEVMNAIVSDPKYDNKCSQEVANEMNDAFNNVSYKKMQSLSLDASLDPIWKEMQEEMSAIGNSNSHMLTMKNILKTWWIPKGYLNKYLNETNPKKPSFAAITYASREYAADIIKESEQAASARRGGVAEATADLISGGIGNVLTSIQTGIDTGVLTLPGLGQTHVSSGNADLTSLATSAHEASQDPTNNNIRRSRTPQERSVMALSRYAQLYNTPLGEAVLRADNFYDDPGFSSEIFNGIGVALQEVAKKVDQEASKRSFQSPQHEAEFKAMMRNALLGSIAQQEICKVPEVVRQGLNVCDPSKRDKLTKHDIKDFRNMSVQHMRAKLDNRCAKIKDRLATICAAINPNATPSMTTEDAMNLFHERFNDPSPSLFSPATEDLSTHRLKLSKFACYFVNRDYPHNTSATCRDLNEKFLVDRPNANQSAIVRMANSRTFGKGCNLANRPSEVAVQSNIDDRYNSVGSMNDANPVDMAKEFTSKDKMNAIISNFGYAPGYTAPSNEKGPVNAVASDPMDSNTQAAMKDLGSIDTGLTTVRDSGDGSSPQSTFNSFDYRPDTSKAPSASTSEIDKAIKEKDAQITSNNAQLDELQRRLAEAEKALADKQKNNDKQGVNDIQKLITQLQSDRQRMLEENSRLKNEIRDMLAERDRAPTPAPASEEVQRIHNSVGHTPSNTPTPASSGQRTATNVAVAKNESGSVLGAGSTTAGYLGAGAGGGYAGATAAAAQYAKDFGYTRGTVQAPTLVLTSEEFSRARFVAADQGTIFSTILANPGEPAFVRQDGVIIKYVAELDEYGKPILDENNNPKLREYRFIDPETNKKKAVAKKVEPVKKEEPKARTRTPASGRALWEKALEELRSGTAE
ncbi:MAG: hypothetical protein OHK0056_13410 [Bacteriovoracaceae bacterium]